jgi:hypothetical protein
METRQRWVLLAYRLPREPSTPRIALWRKLRRLGAVQPLDGLAALPYDSRNREQLEWLAQDVLEAGGEATVWLAEPASARDGRALAETMASAIAQEYRAVIEQARQAQGARPVARRRALARLRSELRRIRARDYIPPPERQEAEAAVEALAARVEVTP